MLFAAQPASAAVGGTTFAVDKSAAKAGDQLTLTFSLTNTENSAIYFAYEAVQPTWPANTQAGAFTVVGCTGDTSDCVTNGNSANFHFNAPILPGATKSVTLTVKITDAPTWGTAPYTLNWAPYVYYEFGQVGGTTTARDQSWTYGVPELQTVIS
ncbi:hypothetical protein [Kitasatospora brasiliensis]|uniref:hypothetical protein n=1 Tax=Kitasatospora brasiliensis TaxID=3058040 RepID=UPI00292D9753|nr:hypothetical protein [Kitasatospora sp. K002]